MLSFRTILVLFLFALIAIVESTNGEPGCDTSMTREEMYDEQTRRSMDNADKFGRITLDCETYTNGGSGGGSGSGNNGFETVIDISVGLFLIAFVAVGIWVVCVRRQKAKNAAAIQPYQGQMGAKEMGNGMDHEKTKTVAMRANV